MEGNYQITVKDWLEHLQKIYDNTAQDMRNSIRWNITLSTLLFASLISIITGYLLPWAYIGLCVSFLSLAILVKINKVNRKMMMDISVIQNDILLKSIDLNEIKDRYLKLCEKYQNPFLTPEYVLENVPLEKRADYYHKWKKERVR